MQLVVGDFNVRAVAGLAELDAPRAADNVCGVEVRLVLRSRSVDDDFADGEVVDDDGISGPRKGDKCQGTD